ncbi:MAG: DUF4102 domain-containing protein [Verrucomicrobia bacterium]|nr:DUF4102 domain-containing protein [Verrucomicrobiota bacterium]
MPRNNAFLPAAIERLGSVPGVRKLDDPETRGLSIELIRSDRRRWIYRRRIPATNVIVTIRGGIFPAVSIGDARQWATTLNAQVEAGIDPRASTGRTSRARSRTRSISTKATSRPRWRTSLSTR